MKRITPALLAVAVAVSGASSAQASPKGGKQDAVRACMKQKGITKTTADAERRAARKACKEQARADRKARKGKRGAKRGTKGSWHTGNHARPAGKRA